MILAVYVPQSALSLLFTVNTSPLREATDVSILATSLLERSVVGSKVNERGPQYIKPVESVGEYDSRLT